MYPTKIRNLVLIFGDQLNMDMSALQDFDPRQDRVWMAEVIEESTKVWVHKARIVYFLSAMRHFKERLTHQGYPLSYYSLQDEAPQKNFLEALKATLSEYSPERVIFTEPGEYAVKQSIEAFLVQERLQYECRTDHLFLSTIAEFMQHAKNRKQLRMEYFYREMRRKHKILLDKNGDPEGGEWNYDSKNRGSFGKTGPSRLPEWPRFDPDIITREVLNLVESRFPNHPGVLDHFYWPVTPEQAVSMLTHFIQYRLPFFGQYQDAMWTNESFLYHSGLSAALNLKLLDPRYVIEQVEASYYKGTVPLESAEGFIRQLLGWREYVRGVYWLYMPNYLGWNALNAQQKLPSLYWTGDTQMQCLKDVIGKTLKTGYAHHIERLMVAGLFSLLVGVQPRQIHEWFLAIYVDAVEWVELPNTLGMCQYVDGGKLASKPYIASGNYIHKMSNYCGQCVFNYQKNMGEDACPFTTLYWDFLIRHQDSFKDNARMGIQLRNVNQKPKEEVEAIQKRAQWVRDQLAVGNL